MSLLRRFIKKFLKQHGYVLEVMPKGVEDPEFDALHERVRLHTMTSVKRQRALYDAMAYITANNVPGDIVECGVWKGGSAMIMAHVLKEAGDTNRDIYLYDTFAGMSAPTDRDVDPYGDAAGARWEALNKDGVNLWDYAPLQVVQSNMESTGYPLERIRYVQGMVEETIPAEAPQKIALLRLDTDWYESTKHELVHLFPRLSKGGVLILDDYGHWKGAREAVDEYFKEHGVVMHLVRIDYTGRIGVKL